MSICSVEAPLKAILILLFSLVLWQPPTFAAGEHGCDQATAQKMVDVALFQLNRVTRYQRETTGYHLIAIDRDEVQMLYLFQKKLNLPAADCQFIYSGAYCKAESLSSKVALYQQFVKKNRARLCFNFSKKLFLGPAK